MHVLKLTQIGNSDGVILQKEMLAKLKLEKGDTVFLTETPEGYVLTPYDPALDEEMQIGHLSAPLAAGDMSEAKLPVPSLLLRRRKTTV